jgi:dUTPase
MVVASVTRVVLKETEELSGTARGQGGFGSTGRS